MTTGWSSTIHEHPIHHTTPLKTWAPLSPARWCTLDRRPQLTVPARQLAARAAWTVQDLRDVIAGGRYAGELFVQYQPVVATVDAQPLAVEALVRWRRPTGELVSPDAFVGVAEQAGLGAELDEWVLRQALAQQVRWDAAGLRVHRVAVNLGRTSVVRPDLMETVLRACQASGAGPDRLALEVLEHDHLVPLLSPEVLGRLQALVECGVTIALDDFGSGHAGIDLLRRLPLQLLKVDRSLVQAHEVVTVPGAPCPERVLAGVVALAASVGVEVTAEGVENGEQRARCARLGVGHLQGWLFSPAVDADAVSAYWDRHFSWAASADR